MYLIDISSKSLHKVTKILFEFGLGYLQMYMLPWKTSEWLLSFNDNYTYIYVQHTLVNVL